jgi:hypothetical protein
VYGSYFRTYAELEKLVSSTEDHVLENVRDIRLAGLLFMRPGQQLTEKEILPSIEYFDARFGNDLHFYVAGWRKTVGAESGG